MRRRKLDPGKKKAERKGLQWGQGLLEEREVPSSGRAGKLIGRAKRSTQSDLAFYLHCDYPLKLREHLLVQ